jgi:hypothetical protein
MGVIERHLKDWAVYNRNPPMFKARTGEGEFSSAAGLVVQLIRHITRFLLGSWSSHRLITAGKLLLQSYPTFQR